MEKITRQTLNTPKSWSRLKETLVGFPIVSDDPHIQTAYERMRHYGQSHMIADMLAHQQAPTGQSDCTFMLGRHDSIGKMPEYIREGYTRLAAANGVTTNGKHYEPRLASFPGDPSAWVDGRDDFKSKVEAKGMSCQGEINVKAPEVKPEPPVNVADDIIEQRVMDNFDKDPEGMAKKWAKDKVGVFEEAEEQVQPPAHLKGN